MTGHNRVKHDSIDSHTIYMSLTCCKVQVKQIWFCQAGMQAKLKGTKFSDCSLPFFSTLWFMARVNRLHQQSVKDYKEKSSRVSRMKT